MSNLPVFTINNSQNGGLYNGAMDDQTKVVGVGRQTLDPNRYATKKTIAQGMLDVALLTANASQLKYVLQVGDKHEFYSLMLGLIITSLVLQGMTGVLAVVMALLDINKKSHETPAKWINHVSLALSLLILAFDTIKMGFDNGSNLRKSDTFLIP